MIHEVGIRVVGSEDLWGNPATRSIAASDPEGFGILREAETCYRKKRVFPDLGPDDFRAGMKLEDYVALREELGETESVYETYAQWYREAKARGLLPRHLEQNSIG